MERERGRERGGGSRHFRSLQPIPHCNTRAPAPLAHAPPHTQTHRLTARAAYRQKGLPPPIPSLTRCRFLPSPTVRLPSCLFLSLSLLHPLPLPPHPRPNHSRPPSLAPPSLPPSCCSSLFLLSLLSSPTPPPPPLRSLSLGIGDSEVCARCPTGRLTPSRRRPRRMPQRTAQDHQPQ